MPDVTLEGGRPGVLSGGPWRKGAKQADFDPRGRWWQGGERIDRQTRPGQAGASQETRLIAGVAPLGGPALAQGSIFHRLTYGLSARVSRRRAYFRQVGSALSPGMDLSSVVSQNLFGFVL